MRRRSGHEILRRSPRVEYPIKDTEVTVEVWISEKNLCGHKFLRLCSLFPRSDLRDNLLCLFRVLFHDDCFVFVTRWFEFRECLLGREGFTVDSGDATALGTRRLLGPFIRRSVTCFTIPINPDIAEYAYCGTKGSCAPINYTSQWFLHLQNRIRRELTRV
jgi:hypothetical protein